MKIDWQKKGRIFIPSGERFFKTHAARPIPHKINDDVLRIFYSSRDNDDRMLPTFIDVDIKKPENIIQVNERPLADLGRIGSFDDSGVTLACILENNNKRYIYYTGWKRRRVVSFEMSIGVFEWGKTDQNLERLYPGPIIGQDKNHPFLTAGPFVMYDENRFKMWYCSGTEWRLVGDKPEPLYTVFYAESNDGINWEPHTEPLIDYKVDGEVITAPWVIKIRNKYHMWYSTRQGYKNMEEKNYVIGYAESPDGIHWTRLDDQVGIKRSDSGWDSEMICYPSFFAYKDVMYMFYSGNNVGKGGIGYAVAENFLS